MISIFSLAKQKQGWNLKFCQKYEISQSVLLINIETRTIIESNSKMKDNITIYNTIFC